MGFLSKLFGKPDEQVQAPKVEDDGPRVQTEVTVASGGELSLVQLSGTTTFAKDAMARLADRYQLADRGYLEIDGQLQREPGNTADPMAVAVHVQGERVGYLPGYVAREVELSDEGSSLVRVQIFTELLPKGLRAEAWAWLADSAPQWQWSQANRPRLSPEAKREAEHAGRRRMVADAVEGGGPRAAEFQTGMVNGVHYLELVEPIKQLKREGRLDDALVLCYAAIQGAEQARDGREPAPWYTEQAAIIHRKLGQHDQEIAVLNRWLEHCPAGRRDGSGIAARLAKVRERQ